MGIQSDSRVETLAEGFAAHYVLARGSHADETATQGVVVSMVFGVICAGAETWL